MPEYIPIADFAEAAGVTKQAVYKRVDKDLVQYCKYVDGRKVISREAVDLFRATNSTEPVEQQQPIDSTDRIVKLLEESNARLNNQLVEMIEMLKREQEVNSELQKQILTLSKDFSDLAKQSNVLISQSQQLQALNSPKTTVDATASKVDEPTSVNHEQPVDRKKKGFFNRLLG